LGIAYALNNKTAIRTSYERVFDPWTNVNQDEENIQGLWPSVINITAGNLNAVNVDTHFESPVGNSALPAATPFNQQGWSVDPHMKTPYSDQWNFGVQREINPTTTLTAAYVGSHDGRAPLGFVANAALTPGPGTPLLRAPFPYVVPGFFTAGWGRASYNGFEFTLDKRFSHGLTYLVSYTWSKTLDLGADQGGFLESYGIQNPYDFNADKSVAGYDLPQIFRFSWVWDFPWRSKSRPLEAAIRGWHVNGIASLTSGRPYNVGISGDNANIGTTLDPAQRPDLVGNPKLSNPTILQWFNKAAFGAPAPYTFGNEGRNIMRGDWFKNLDLGIFRDFYITETKRLQFRFESFNLTNTPTFGLPNATYGSLTEGQVSGTLSSSRQIQFALKFLF
jgi:hypothetical protein